MASVVRLRRVPVLRVFWVVLLAALSAKLSALQRSVFADTQLYEAVLERLFRIDSPSDVSDERLRFTYCEDGEMQIVIHPEPNGGFQIQLWSLPKGAPTVWTQLETMWSSSRELTADEAVGRITLKRESKSISKSAALSRIISARPVTVGLDGRQEIVLEVARYDLSFNSLSKSLSMTVYEPQDWRKSQDPIVRWMGQVRLEIDKL